MRTQVCLIVLVIRDNRLATADLPAGVSVWFGGQRAWTTLMQR